MNNLESSAGFTVVELLVTLFIASAFILTGYQLYLVITKDSINIQQRTEAASIATDFMQRRAASTSGCNPDPATFSETAPSYSSLPNLTITTIVSPIYGCVAGNNAVKVETTVSYGPTVAKEDVTHAILVVK